MRPKFCPIDFVNNDDQIISLQCVSPIGKSAITGGKKCTSR